MSTNCLYCYQPLNEGETDFHEKCSRRFLGTYPPPVFDAELLQLKEAGETLIRKRVAVTGVQPKLSLDIERLAKTGAPRWTVAGLSGHFILKPPSAVYPELPENEDLTMHLATIAGINTAAHSLLRLPSGELAYVTRRFDRQKKEKIACEDLCQLSELLTEAKYKSSMEKAGKTLALYATFRLLDAISFFEITLFSFLCGNADLHLKNISLLKDQSGYSLSPAYDLLNTRLVNKGDKEEMALTVNGRKNRLRKSDFDQLALSLGLEARQRDNVYWKLELKKEKLLSFIDRSFLKPETKLDYRALMKERMKRLYGA